MVLIVVLIAGGVIAATRGGTKIDPTKLQKVERGDLAKSVVATGKVEPITKVEVKSKASGIVKKLLVDYGDLVKKGQVLTQLDKVEIEAQVAQEQADDAARAAEEGRTHKPKPAEILAKMVEGKVRKFLAEITLHGQAFVKDADQTVEKLLKSKNAAVGQFARVVVGEGIEKKKTDFAAEVMEQAGLKH